MQHHLEREEKELALIKRGKLTQAREVTLLSKVGPMDLKA